MTYGEFLAQNIFTPLHMQHSRTYNTRRSKGEIISNYAYGFVYHDSLKQFILPDSIKELSFVITLDGIQGDGIVNSTTGDLFKWDQALYENKIVSAASKELMFKPGLSNYGYGLVISDLPIGFAKIPQQVIAGPQNLQCVSVCYWS